MKKVGQNLNSGKRNYQTLDTGIRWHLDMDIVSMGKDGDGRILLSSHPLILSWFSNLEQYTKWLVKSVVDHDWFMSSKPEHQNLCWME